MNYLPSQMRGVTGADSLQADLVELEANRIQGVRLTTPVKHTISLAREFPVQFGQLKNTGACRLHTVERRYARLTRVRSRIASARSQWRLIRPMGRRRAAFCARRSCCPVMAGGTHTRATVCRFLPYPASTVRTHFAR
jgi:hypothetical protein